jgi:hypothetical protein
MQDSARMPGHHDPMTLDLPCPNCGSQMYPEQAHNRCPSCLYYEPCCDGAPQACRTPIEGREAVPVPEHGSGFTSS